MKLAVLEMTRCCMFTSWILRETYVSDGIVHSENMKLSISLHSHYCFSNLTAFSPQRTDCVQDWFMSKTWSYNWW